MLSFRYLLLGISHTEHAGPNVSSPGSTVPFVPKVSISPTDPGVAPFYQAATRPKSEIQNVRKHGGFQDLSLNKNSIFSLLRQA